MKTIDFETDIKREIRKISQEIGCKIPWNEDWKKMLTDYLTVRMKIIDPKPRKIFVNPDFDLYDHPKKDIILKMMQIAGKGGNLNPFQSKRLFETNFHDHLLNEWKIYHFHISLQKEKKSSFVKQTNSLLFVYIDDEKIIFLGTDTHKEGIFGDAKWVEILHDHFPDVIKSYKDDTIKSVYPQLDSVERQTLWNKGYTIALTQVKDVVYRNPGIGRSTTGRALNVNLAANEIFRWVFKVKEQLNDSMLEICQALGITLEDADFKMIIGDKTFELIELISNSSLLEFPQQFSGKGGRI